MGPRSLCNAGDLETRKWSEGVSVAGANVWLNFERIPHHKMMFRVRSVGHIKLPVQQVARVMWKSLQTL